LETLTKLTILNLSNCPFLEDLSPLGGLTQLKELDLSFDQFGTLFDYSQVHDLTPLAALKQLTSLNLAGCEQVNDLSPLVGLKQLASLNLSKCPSITDLSVLGKLDSLKELVVSRIMVNGIKIPPSREVKVTVV
jgi:internalin A